MARYFMHLFNSLGSVPDDEGVEAADLDQASAIAAANIRSMLSDEVKQGRFDLRGRIEIADAAGNTVRTVAFRKAVQLFTEGSA